MPGQRAAGEAGSCCRCSRESAGELATVKRFVLLDDEGGGAYCRKALPASPKPCWPTAGPLRLPDFNKRRATTFYAAGAAGLPRASLSHRQLVLRTLAVCSPGPGAATGGLPTGTTCVP